MLQSPLILYDSENICFFDQNQLVFALFNLGASERSNDDFVSNIHLKLITSSSGEHFGSYYLLALRPVWKNDASSSLIAFRLDLLDKNSLSPRFYCYGSSLVCGSVDIADQSVYFE